MAEEAGEELHDCRTGRRAYAWAPARGRRSRYGGLVCRGCGARGTCGPCAEEEGGRVFPSHVPLLSRRHGGLDQLGLPHAIRAIAVGMPAARERRDAQPDQLVLLSDA